MWYNEETMPRKQSKTERLKTEFIATASHQLRMPLTANKWYLEMFLHGDFGPLASRQKEFLQEIYETNEKMIALVNDLLSVARLEEGKILPHLVRFPISQPLRSAIKDVSSLAERKHISLKVSTPPIPPLLTSEPRLLYQVFLNLLTNAIHYSPENTEIGVSLSLKGKEILVAVKDSGIGVSAKDKKYIFSKFFRSEAAKKMEPKGTGLGLFIVKSILQKMGGKIWLESEEGKGSTFSFSLPLQ